MKRKVRNILTWYLIACFAASGILSFSFWNQGELNNPFDTIVPYLPGLTVLGLYLFKLKKPVFKSGELGLSLVGFKYWILAPALITSLCFLSYGASIILNPGLLKSNEEITYTLKESGIYFGHIGLGLPAISLINTFLGSLVNIPTYLGQELGWRAFMQPRLLKIYNPILAFISGGIVWGLWYYFFFGHVFNYSTSPLIGCMLTILFCIPIGVLLQYFYNKSQSIFVAALAHAALFESIETATLILRSKEMNMQLYGPMGISGIVIFWVVALVLFMKNNPQTIHFINKKKYEIL